jgi:hypothetical protein
MNVVWKGWDSVERMMKRRRLEKRLIRREREIRGNVGYGGSYVKEIDEK